MKSKWGIGSWIDGNNQIDPGYLSAVQTVVDWCMEEDGIIPRIQIPQKAGKGDLDDDGPVGFWRCDGVDLIGIHNDKIRSL